MAEPERLAALRSYHVLDTLPEASYDRLTELAAELFDAPIALVSLVEGERQWFKSRRGVEATETPRAWSFCTYAVAGGPGATFVVENALLDPRFASNPLVEGDPNIRFYAGAALTTPDGENLGALCVIDTKPRSAPSSRDLDRLRALAEVVVGELEMRRTTRRAAETQRLLDLAEAMSGVGRWRLNLADGQITWSDEVYRIHGVTRDSFDPNLDEALGFYPPEDREQVVALLETSRSEGCGFEFQLRLDRSDGARRHVTCRAECEFDDHGRAQALFGVFQDVTGHVLALETAETARRAAAEDSRRAAVAEEIAGLGHWRVDFPSGTLTWSDQMYVIYGLDRLQPVDTAGVLARVHPEDLELTRERLERDLKGEAFGERPTIRIIRPDGEIRWVIGHVRTEQDAAGTVCALVGTLMDVTRETLASRRTAESEARYRLLTENSHDLIVKMSPEGVLEYVSPSITALLGFRPDELVGRSAEHLVHPSDLEACRASFAAAAAGLDVARADYRLRRKDGSEVWVDARPRGLRDEKSGEITGVSDVIRDVTGRKEAETALAASEARFRLLADNASDIVTKCGLDGRFSYVSPAVARVTGYTPEEIVGRPALELVHPEDRERVRAEIDESLRLAGGREIEHRHIRKDGRVIWVQSRPSLARDPAGRPMAVTDVMRDVTEHRQAEAAVRESEARYRLLADNSTDLVLKIGRDGRIDYASPGSRMLGYEPEEMIGLKRLDLVHPDDRAYATQLVADLVAGEDVSLRRRREYRFRHKEGRHLWLEGNPTLVRDAAGAPEAVVTAFRDVSARRALEDSLEEAKKAAEAAVAVKSEFVANMSHEIRTPLTAIIGFSGLLADREDLPENARLMIGRVKGASSALLAIVNDVLDFSKLEAGQMSIDPKPVDVLSLAGEALAMFGPQAEKKALALAFEAAPEVPGHLLVDPDRLRQILLNLIGNAVKFTDEGGVHLRLGYEAGSRALSIRVEDTGPGMDEDQRSRLFQRFSQVDASSTRRHGGTGLGLAICQGLAEAMGGSIHVESAPGAGSTFSVTLTAPPAAAPLSSSDGSLQIGDLAGLRVLIADDKPVNRELARALLEPFEVEISEAADGREALVLAQQAPFDAILLDLHMPVLDGVGALRELRATPGPNQDVPVLAFTADREDAVNCGSTGFDGYIGKPIVALNLISALLDATDWRTPAPGREPASAGSAGAS